MVSSALSRDLTGQKVVIANTQCFVAIFLWASGFVALEFLVDDWGALSLNAIRLGVSALFLMLWWILRDGLSVITQAPWSKGLMVGGLGWGIGSLLLFLGQRMSDPVTTTIVVAMMPLAGAAIEMIFEKRKLLWGEYLGIGLALSGGYLATGVSLAKSEVGIGVVLCFLAIFLFAWATRATTRQLGNLTATGQTTVTMIGGAVVSFGLYLGFLAVGSAEVHIGPVTLSVIWPLFIFLLPSSGIAQLLWIIGAGRLGIMIASFHMNAAPFYVMVILATLFDAAWQPARIIGAALVILGVIIAQSRHWNQKAM